MLFFFFQNFSKIFTFVSFFFFFFFPPSLFVFTAKLEPKETCSGTRVNDGGRLLLVLSLVVIGTLFSHRIATRAYDELPEIFDPKGFV